VNLFCETERLLLRRFTEVDVDDLVTLDADPAVMRFINGGRATLREHVRDDVLPRFLFYYDRYPGFGVWAAVERSTGEFLGWFALRPPADTDPEVVELGYRLRRSAWGKGYATEGSRALIRKGFIEYGARRVIAQTMTVNTASRRVMEKCGLSYVRTFFEEWPDVIEGSDQGDVEYAVDRADWERRIDERLFV
jgi:RimJ/RimL family protein N-acetyltransferase